MAIGTLLFFKYCCSSWPRNTTDRSWNTHACTHNTRMHHTPHTHAQHSTYTRTRAKKWGQKRVIYSNLHFSELELLSQPNTSPQLQRESPAPRWSCNLVELLLQSWFGGAGALPNTPLNCEARYIVLGASLCVLKKQYLVIGNTTTMHLPPKPNGCASLYHCSLEPLPL
jgi:hypothetical protein